jgi:hypothetical protein
LKDKGRAYKVLLGRLVERGSLGEVSVDGKIILKWYLRKAVRRAWGGLIWLNIGDK